MAQAIKETPVLSGKDAERFEQKIQENASRKVSREEYDRAMRIYKEALKSNN